ncbi:MAG: hypothetical protein A2474_05920 [Elusimicrobia bacterium RIFOXYC2_FULL_34_12]|nr:MAG: hypothetical protein A2474_05920 [Elusimicrobia bacterium RIFOXYC2_FULL_34_12]OGS38749.1 MAG: hypothetical protein A2551_00935 [Elusimicrobia bacterium RIFOXYD2_FULL_34_30]HAM38968.1 hypothetical protein [Elusimicrobiota bacterium]
MLSKASKTEKITNFFIIWGIICILSIVVLIGRGKRWFSNSFSYYSIFKKGDGLSKGMLVYMNGVPIGSLTSYKLDGNNNIALKISVFEEHGRRIRKGSVLRLVSPLLGSKILEIVPGSVNDPQLANTSYITPYDSDEGKRILLGKMSEMPVSTAENIMSNISNMVERLNDPSGPLFSNLENFKIITNNISKISDKLLTNQEKIDNIFKYAEDTTQNIDIITRSLRQSSFFKDKNTKKEKSSIDLNESYDPYKKSK